MLVRTVFLSSTGSDLREHRDKAFQALQKLDGWKCVRMEDFEARAWAVESFCSAKVRECDLFIGIIGHRFGEGPKSEENQSEENRRRRNRELTGKIEYPESFTHREYRVAVAAGRPRLLFLASDDFPIPANLNETPIKIDAQAQFRRELYAKKDQIVAMGFNSPDDLARQIVTAVYHFDRERSGVSLNADPSKYLEILWRETAWIDIRGLRVSGGAVHRFRIDELFTPLTTMFAQPDEDLTDEAIDQQPMPLQLALENRRIVLVGDPGAGKSTFLRRIAYAACETLLGWNPLAASEMLPATLPVKPSPLPILIRAATLAEFIRRKRDHQAAECPVEAHSPEWVVQFLEVTARERQCGVDAGFFRQHLECGALLLLDGLDEIGERSSRKAITKLVEATSQAFPNSVLVATSRPTSYGGETMIPGFATVQIGPLEREAVGIFVGNWCRALLADTQAASVHQTELLAAIRSKPAISALAVNPVMLTALAALHWNRTRLPDQRSELYESILFWLAHAREDTRKEKRTDSSPVECLALMQHLAYSMHCDPRGRRVEITRHAGARVLASRFRSVEEDDERVIAAERFLEEEETDSGILVSRGNTLRFWHLTFQEYLAAKALACRDQERKRLLLEEGKLYLPEWRETVLLLVGVLCKQDAERVDALFQDMLSGLDTTPGLAASARCVGLIGIMLNDLKAWGYRIDDSRYRENLARVMEIFDCKAARNLTFTTRLEAADALGQAGDPRLEQDNWILVEGGTFLMGAQKTNPHSANYDQEASEKEAPVHYVTVEPFEIGRYPLTVYEYARFVDDGGYHKEHLWAGLEHEFGMHCEPEEWRAQLTYPNRPVVGVSWYEAMAYCTWAGVRLPTEEEWEYVARSGTKGFRYPWGEQAPDEFRANFRASRLGFPTPVGLYPDGASSLGVCDLLGNVWEWMADPWSDYAIPSDCEVSDGKVIRGSSSHGTVANLRASNRIRYQPQNRSVNLGFRCARRLSGR